MPPFWLFAMCQIRQGLYLSDQNIIGFWTVLHQKHSLVHAFMVRSEYITPKIYRQRRTTSVTFDATSIRDHSCYLVKKWIVVICGSRTVSCWRSKTYGMLPSNNACWNFAKLGDWTILILRAKNEHPTRNTTTVQREWCGLDWSNPRTSTRQWIKRANWMRRP